MKRQLLALFALVMFLVAAGFGIQRFVFALGARSAEGTVVSLSGRHDWLGKSRARPLTRFTADVAYRDAAGSTHTIQLPAGDTPGWQRETTGTSLRPGRRIPVVYSSRWPSWAYRDEPTTLWGAPFMAALVGVMAAFAARMEACSL